MRNAYRWMRGGGTALCFALLLAFAPGCWGHGHGRVYGHGHTTVVRGSPGRVVVVGPSRGGGHHGGPGRGPSRHGGGRHPGRGRGPR